jgi:hypothetical protein
VQDESRFICECAEQHPAKAPRFEQVAKALRAIANATAREMWAQLSLERHAHCSRQRRTCTASDETVRRARPNLLGSPVAYEYHGLDTEIVALEDPILGGVLAGICGYETWDQPFSSPVQEITQELCELLNINLS